MGNTQLTTHVTIFSSIPVGHLAHSSSLGTTALLHATPCLSSLSLHTPIPWLCSWQPKPRLTRELSGSSACAEKPSLFPLCLLYSELTLLTPDVCGIFPTPSDSLWYYSWVSYNLTESWCYHMEIASDPMGLRAQSHKASPPPNFRCQLQVVCPLVTHSFNLATHRRVPRPPPCLASTIC